MVNLVEAPQGPALPFGLLSVATVVDGGPAHWELGTSYLADYCGPSYVTDGACVPPPDLGTIEASGDGSLDIVVEASDFPPGDYTVNWGDGSDDTQTDDFVLVTHTYEEGEYVISVTGPDGYTATILVEALEEPTGPFEGTVFREKVPVDGNAYVDGYPFTVYHLFGCRLPGSGTVEDTNARVRRSLAGGEGRAVETVMARYMAEHEDAEDITPTPGTPVHPVEAVALLERYAASNYGGLPVLHAPRDLGTLLTTHGTVVREGTHLETVQGVPFASGGGYADLPAPGDADPAGAGEAWLYVTGQVLARRGEVNIVPRAKTPGTNDFLALGERPYVLSAECIVAAVLVSTGYAEPAA